MADPSTTVPLTMREAMPVRTISVAVIEGPDEGIRWEGEQATIGTAKGADVCLSDDTVSGYHVRLTALKGGVDVTDFGSTNHTFCQEIRIERGVVPPGSTLRIGRTSLRIDAGRPKTVELHDRDRLGELLGRTEAMRRLMKDMRRVAQSNIAVLVVGESGTGKEIIARGIHEASPRAAEPFVTIDCGSLTPTLVASELFGHEKGAFTGADGMKKGALEHADGGTVFLDEIGELPAELQATLLGALERKRFCRVGGHTEVDVDVRLVSATNRDLRADVNAELFRLDLYYRLAVVTLEVPPLRERVEDIPMLVEHFMRQEGATHAVTEILPKETMARMARHRWPGNVRELRNFVQATLAMGEPVQLREDLGDDDGDALAEALAAVAELPYNEARKIVVDEFEASYVKRLLERNLGNVARAARHAQMARSHLNELVRRHRLRD